MDFEYLGTRSIVRTGGSFRLVIPPTIVVDFWKKPTVPKENVTEILWLKEGFPVSFIKSQERISIEPTDILLSRKEYPKEIIDKASQDLTEFRVSEEANENRNMQDAYLKGQMTDGAYHKKRQAIENQVYDMLVKHKHALAGHREIGLLDISSPRQVMDLFRIREKSDREGYLSDLLAEVKGVTKNVQRCKEALSHLEEGAKSGRVSKDDYSQLRSMYEDDLSRLEAFRVEAAGVLSP